MCVYLISELGFELGQSCSNNVSPLIRIYVNDVMASFQKRMDADRMNKTCCPLLLIKKLYFKQYQMHFGAIKYPYMQMTDAKHVETIIALLPPLLYVHFSTRPYSLK